MRVFKWMVLISAVIWYSYRMQIRYSIKFLLLSAVVFGALFPLAYCGYRQSNPLGQSLVLEQLNRCSASSRKAAGDSHSRDCPAKYMYEFLCEHGFDLRLDQRTGRFTFASTIAFHTYDRDLECEAEKAIRIIQWVPDEYFDEACAR